MDIINGRLGCHAALKTLFWWASKLWMGSSLLYLMSKTWILGSVEPDTAYKPSGDQDWLMYPDCELPACCFHPKQWSSVLCTRMSNKRNCFPGDPVWIMTKLWSAGFGATPKALLSNWCWKVGLPWEELGSTAKTRLSNPEDIMYFLLNTPPTPETADEWNLWRRRDRHPSSFSVQSTTPWSQPPVTSCDPLLQGRNWILLTIPFWWGLSSKNLTPGFFFRRINNAHLWSPSISSVHSEQCLAKRMPSQIFRPPPLTRWNAVYSMAQIDSKPFILSYLPKIYNTIQCTCSA